MMIMFDKKANKRNDSTIFFKEMNSTLNTETDIIKVHYPQAVIRNCCYVIFIKLKKVVTNYFKQLEI